MNDSVTHALLNFYERKDVLDHFDEDGNLVQENETLISCRQIEGLLLSLASSIEYGLTDVTIDSEESRLLALELVREASEAWLQYGIYSLIARGEIIPMHKDGKWTYIQAGASPAWQEIREEASKA